MIKKVELKILLALYYPVVSGCATVHSNYTQPDPNFKLNDREKIANEVKTYSLDLKTFQTSIDFELDQNGTYYTSEALNSKMNKISTQSVSKMNDANALRKLGILTSVIGVVVLLANTSNSNGFNFTNLIPLGIAMVFNGASFLFAKSATNQFNECLVKKIGNTEN